MKRYQAHVEEPRLCTHVCHLPWHCIEDLWYRILATYSWNNRSAIRSHSFSPLFRGYPAWTSLPVRLSLIHPNHHLNLWHSQGVLSKSLPPSTSSYAFWSLPRLNFSVQSSTLATVKKTDGPIPRSLYGNEGCVWGTNWCSLWKAVRRLSRCKTSHWDGLVDKGVCHTSLATWVQPLEHTLRREERTDCRVVLWPPPAHHGTYTKVT